MKWMHKLVIPQICSHWDKVADFLEYPIAKKREIQKSEHGAVYKCCEKLMEDWLTSDRGITPKTWSKLVSVLKEISDLFSEALSIEQSLVKNGLLLKNGK